MRKRIALISSGPSLTQTYSEEVGGRFDLRICVNSAAGLFRCDWWSCGDPQTFERVEPLGAPRLFTMDASDGYYQRSSQLAARFERFRPGLLEWCQVNDRLTGAGLPPCWSSWSVTAGLVLAVWLGAGRIDVYGHDMTGETDVAGFRLAKRQNNWPRVRESWANVLDWTLRRGVEVVRHLQAEGVQ